MKNKFKNNFLVFLFLILLPSVSRSTDDLGYMVTGLGGGNLGGISIEANEFTGASTYKAQIPIPKAKGGIEPKLILNYNSHSRNPNSWVGFGWEMDLGIIERIPERGGLINYVEGTNLHVRYLGQTQELERIAIDINPADYGLSFAAGVKVDLYREKHQSSFNIYFHLRSYRDPDFIEDGGWLVIDKTGRHYKYGYTNAKEQIKRCSISADSDDCQLLHWVARWFLEEVIDPNGNNFKIEYSSDLYPSKIFYDDVEIEFQKINSAQSTHRYFPTYRQGFLARDEIGVRLDKVIIYIHGTRVQRFDFSYSNSEDNGQSYLQKVLQYGVLDSVSLPPLEFAYNEQDGSVMWDPDGHTRQASTDTNDGTSTGFLNYYTQIIDMNGDGLPDMVTSYDDSNTIYVYFNNGNDFVYIPGRSEWKEPVNYQCGNCVGKLNTYINSNGLHQTVFLMDMNGDGLPDRVFAIEADNGDTGQKDFLIHFNNGNRFLTAEIWRDPYRGIYPGTADADKWFMDMNGDGLLDRVISSKCDDYCSNDDLYTGQAGFIVHYNNGAGFIKDAIYWKDPIAQMEGYDTAYGRLSASNNNKVFADTLDINRDGLPDRIWQTNLYDGEGNFEGKGFTVSLNRNGLEWAELEENEHYPDSFIINGVDRLGILDKLLDSDDHGFISSDTFDLIDMNNDGYLDRIEGNTKNGFFHVYTYRGMVPNETLASYSDEHVFMDPVNNGSNQWDGSGYVTKGQPDNNDGPNIHTFIRDITGDGYPERITVEPRNDDSGNKLYLVYPMRVNTVTFSDSPREWNDARVTQPIGSLKKVDDHRGNQLVVEYLPSSWPKRWPEPNNRLLPFNMYLAHKIYHDDYSFAVTNSEDEAIRNPGMRWTTYEYSGGNLYIHDAIKVNPNDKDDDILASPFYSRFNGFQKVEKQIFRGDDETWPTFITKTKYHQAAGDSHAIPDDYWQTFDAAGYSHLANSGKPYLTEIEQTGEVIVSEKNTWFVDAPEGQDYVCNNSCFSRLDSREKTNRESDSESTRVTKIEFEYDNFGNIRKEIFKGGSGPNLSEIITRENTYYPLSNFDLNLQMRDRARIQFKKFGTTLYRKKEFQYDKKGNPEVESLYLNETGSQKQTINRTFTSDGRTQTITDSSGVTKTISYDHDNLFPEKESIPLPQGGTLVTSSTFNRLNSAESLKANDQGVGQQTNYDQFGRPIQEMIVNSSNIYTKFRTYDYRYMNVSLGSLASTIVLRTETFEINPDYPELQTIPKQIVYTDGKGRVIQSCTYTERGNYRRVLTRMENNGRNEMKTEPEFAASCDFQSNILQDERTYLTQKDLQGRPIYVESPAGDLDSPTATVSLSYTNNSNGYLVKTATTSTGKIKSETYDFSENLVEVVDSDNKKLEYSYSPVGDLIEVKGDSKLLTSITYDLLGRKISMQDANMGTWSYSYNSEGQLNLQTDALGQKIENRYDSIGRIEWKFVYRSDGSAEKFIEHAYDSGDFDHDVKDGELFKVTEYDAGGTLVRQTRFSYDAEYRRTSKITRYILGLGEFTQEINNDYRGLVQSVVYPGGQEVHYKYDRINNIQNVCSNADCDLTNGEIYYSIDPSVGYDVFGSLLQESYGNGVKADYLYYANSHRLKEKKIYNGNDIFSHRTYQFDEYSNITKLGDPKNQTGSSTYSSVVYDQLDRMTSYTSNSGTRNFTYDNFGNIKTNEKFWGNNVYEYDSVKVHQVVRIGNNNFTYDANGNMITDPDRTMQYDAENQLVKVSMTNNLVSEYDYDYNGARVFKKTTREDPLHKIHESKTYYLGDAIEIRDDKLILNFFANNKKIATKNLGDLDDLTAMTFDTLRKTNIKPELKFVHLQPLVFLLLTLFIIASFRPTYSANLYWSFIRRYRALHPPSFIYSFSKFFLNFVQSWSSYTKSLSQALNQFHSNTSVKLVSLVFVFILVMQSPLSLMAGDSGFPAGSIGDETYFYYIHGDHLGSSHAITEGNKEGGRHSGIHYNRGTLIQRIEYDPFGQESYALNPNLKFDPSFTGQMYDVDTGLYYYKSRYYNSKLGRFIQADTLVPDSKDLQSYNKYSYVTNNPLKYIDPTGHFSIDFNPVINNQYGNELGQIVEGLYLGNGLGSFNQGLVGGSTSSPFGGLFETAIGHGLSGLVSDDTGVVGGSGTSLITLNLGGGGWRGMLFFGLAILGGALTTVGQNQYTEAKSKDGYENEGIEFDYTLDLLDSRYDLGDFSLDVGEVLEIDSSDGLSLEEANYWYRSGNGQSIMIDASQLRILQTSSFDSNRMASGIVLGSDYFVYGQVTLAARVNGSIGIFYDTYNFEPHRGDSFLTGVRNWGTLFGGFYAGQGKGFDIHFTGNANVYNPFGF